MLIKENFSLKKYNTFGIDVKARCFAELSSDDEIKAFIRSDSFLNNSKFLILGGGSNMLFTGDFDGVVVKINTKGIKIVRESKFFTYVQANAGEIWNEVVQYCVRNNYYGIENLSLIPGNAGSAPIQNIGAYGVEIKDVFFKLNALDISSGEVKNFSKEDCRFGYRDSIFKNELKNKFVILNIVLKLSKEPCFNVEYGSIREELGKTGNTELTLASVNQAVCNIRNSKLPAPEIIGNAGSFFKNPVISKQKYAELRVQFPDINAFKIIDNNYKLSAGWLIEQCGWKGKRRGDAGVYEKQALVIVNHGNATGADIINMAEDIRQSVYDRFGVNLENEVNIIS